MTAPSNDRAGAAGHTPGPWRHHQVFCGYDLLRDEILSADGVITDDIRDPRDARLIAAAPDFASVAPDAVKLLNRYAVFIRDHVPAADLEMHPYLPEIERVANELAAALSKARAGGDL